MQSTGDRTRARTSSKAARAAGVSDAAALSTTRPALQSRQDRAPARTLANVARISSLPQLACAPRRLDEVNHSSRRLDTPRRTRPPTSRSCTAVHSRAATAASVGLERARPARRRALHRASTATSARPGANRLKDRPCSTTTQTSPSRLRRDAHDHRCLCHLQHATKFLVHETGGASASFGARSPTSSRVRRPGLANMFKLRGQFSRARACSRVYATTVRAPAPARVRSDWPVRLRARAPPTGDPAVLLCLPHEDQDYSR